MSSPRMTTTDVHITTTPIDALERAAHEAARAMDDAWQEYHQLRNRLLSEIPEAYREAAATGTVVAMTLLAEEAATLPAAINAAEIIARRAAVVHTVAHLQATEARLQGLRATAEEARLAHQHALSTASRADYLKGIPKPEALVAYEVAQLAHGQAQADVEAAPRELATAIERALLSLPTCR